MRLNFSFNPVVFRYIIIFAFLPLNLFCQALIPDEIKREVLQRTEAGMYQQIIIGVMRNDKTEYLIFNGNPSYNINENSPVNVSGILPFFMNFQLMEALKNEQLLPGKTIDNYLPKDFRMKDRLDRKIRVQDVIQQSYQPDPLPSLTNEQTFSLMSFSEQELLTFLGKSGLLTKTGSYYEQLPILMKLCGFLIKRATGIGNDVYLNNFFEINKLENSFVAKKEVYEFIELPGLIRSASLHDYFYGSLFSSVSDMLMMTQIFFTNNSTYLKVLENPNLWFQPDHNSCKLSFGLYKFYHKSSEIYYQKGNYLGMNCFIAINPEINTSVVIYADHSYPVDDIGFCLVNGREKLWNIPSDSAYVGNLRITGEYFYNGEDAISVVKQGDEILLYWGNTGGLVLESVSFNTFVTIFPDFLFQFETDEFNNTLMYVIYPDGKKLQYLKGL